MITDFTILVSPVFEYVELTLSVIYALDLEDEPFAAPHFEIVSSSMRTYAPWTPELERLVEQRCQEQGWFPRYKRERCPRLHEPSWQLANGIRELKG